MVVPPFLRRAALALLLGAAGAVPPAVPSHAQPVYPQQYRDPRAYPPGYYPGKLVQPAQPQPGFSLRRLFGGQEEAVVPAPAKRRPVAKPRRPPPPPPAAVVKQEKPKPNPSSHVVVFGDALADFAGQGLDDLFSDEPEVAVVRKTRAEGGLSRDPAEWPNFIRETLDSGQKTTLAVVMLGANDRQAIREGEDNVEALSERWKVLYRQRVDAVLKAFRDRGIPVVWIGLPPMKNSKVSEDLLVMNEIYRESVLRHGAAYVDIWPGFVDEENRYAATGPDVDGEPARLRTNDGVLFTKAGARKVAHFADTDIERILENKPSSATATQPAGAPAASPDGTQSPASVEAAIPPPPDAALPVHLPSKPLIGPVLPLTRADVTPGGALLTTAPRLAGDHAYGVQRALRAGIAPSSRPGRADDYRWPSP